MSANDKHADTKPHAKNEKTFTMATHNDGPITVCATGATLSEARLTLRAWAEKGIHGVAIPEQV